MNAKASHTLPCSLPHSLPLSLTVEYVLRRVTEKPRADSADSAVMDGKRGSGGEGKRKEGPRVGEEEEGVDDKKRGHV